MKQNNLHTKDEEIIDVTKEMKERCFHKRKGYENTLEKVEKVGNIYIITFAEGYTAFCQKERKARKVTEVQWYAKIAQEQKGLDKTEKDYIKEFMEHNIICDGKTIPEFIDIEQKAKNTEIQEIKKADTSKKSNTKAKNKKVK